MDIYSLFQYQAVYIYTNHFQAMEPGRNTDLASPITKRIKHYVFNTKDFLGRGNFSNVYRGINEQTNQPVAIKVKSLEPLKDPKLNQLHRSQINVLLSLDHPNVIQTYDIVEEGNQCFIIGQLCQGGDLDMYVKKKGLLDQDTAAPFIKDVLEGMVYLSSMNIVHRDLKVANVFLSGLNAKIADFGFAVFARQNFRDANIGSPFYMPPQSFIHCVYGPKSDVWSFGLFIYELFHGNSPYATCVYQSDLRRELSIPFNRTKIKPTLSVELKEVIYRCLEIDDLKRISFQQLRQTEYVRRIYGEAKSQRHQIQARTNNTRQGALERDNRDFVRFGSIQRQSSAQKGIQLRISFNAVPQLNEQTQQKKSRKNHFLCPIKQDHRQNEINQRPVSNWKRFDHIPAPEPKRSRIFSRDSRKSTETYKIISTTISFKVAVTLLHYCRCIYHYIKLLIQLAGQRSEIQFMSNWLILILEELKLKMNENDILFEGKNRTIKIQKFREVRTDYERRYTDHLKQYTQNFNNKSNLQQIKSFMLVQFRKYDELISKQTQQSLLQLGIFNVLIFDATRILKICQQQKNYSRLDKYKDLQEALTLSAQKFTPEVYSLFKKRMIVH